MSTPRARKPRRSKPRKPVQTTFAPSEVFIIRLLSFVTEELRDLHQAGEVFEASAVARAVCAAFAVIGERPQGPTTEKEWDTFANDLVAAAKDAFYEGRVEPEAPSFPGMQSECLTCPNRSACTKVGQA